MLVAVCVIAPWVEAPGARLLPIDFQVSELHLCANVAGMNAADLLMS